MKNLIKEKDMELWKGLPALGCTTFLEERYIGLYCKYSLEVLTAQHAKIKIHQENVIDKVKNTHYNVFKFLTKMQ